MPQRHTVRGRWTAANSNHGAIVSAYDGKQAHVTVLRSTAGFVAVSCPYADGCWALGVTNGNAHPVLARINSAGRVTRTIVHRWCFGGFAAVGAGQRTGSELTTG